MTNMALAKASLQQLFNEGVREIIVCAGARNAPLVSLLSEPQASTTAFSMVHFFDERSASFFALGRVLAIGRPVAVVTTSGTAAAELLPATVEAFYQGLPLVLVTADRPKVYRGSGAPQAIEQVGIFSHYVERCWDLDASGGSLAFTLSSERPTHINICFAEPLLDDATVRSLDWQSSLVPPPIASCSSGVSSVLPSVDLSTPLEISMRRPLVIVSGLAASARADVLRWLQDLRRPVWAEATSGLRGHPTLLPFELQGGAPQLRQLDIDGVIRIGGVPTLRLWRDLEMSDLPVLHFSHLPFSGLARRSQLHRLTDLSRAKLTPLPWSPEEQERDKHRAEQLGQILQKLPLSEVGLVHALTQVIPNAARVFLGNSLPIREWDLAARRSGFFEVFANRGANGIDGLISTFIGVSTPAASNWGLIGDLSALYDLSGPWALREREIQDLNLVILNNGGGKIFERMFNNPQFENRHSLAFKHWADMWGLDYLRMDSPMSLAPALRPRIIELVPEQKQTQTFWEMWEGVQ